MNGKRTKRAHKLMLSVYGRVFGLRAPYQLILDADFLETCLQQKMLFRDALPLVLGGPVKLFTTACVLNQLRHSHSQAVFNARKLEIRRCTHSGSPVSGAECIKSIVDVSNKHHYGVCAQQADLRTDLRAVPGTPLLFIRRGMLLLEAPSEATLQQVASQAKPKSAVDDDELKAIEKIAPVPKGPSQATKESRKGLGVSPLSSTKAQSSQEREEGKEEEKEEGRKPRKRKKLLH